MLCKTSCYDPHNNTHVRYPLWSPGPAAPIHYGFLYRLAMCTPDYLLEPFILTLVGFGCQSLHSAYRSDFVVPYAHTATKQNRAPSIVGPVWNSLQSYLCSLLQGLS